MVIDNHQTLLYVLEFTRIGCDGPFLVIWSCQCGSGNHPSHTAHILPRAAAFYVQAQYRREGDRVVLRLCDPYFAPRDFSMFPVYSNIHGVLDVHGSIFVRHFITVTRHVLICMEDFLISTDIKEDRGGEMVPVRYL